MRAAATPLSLSTSERAELLREPEKFAARAEAVLTGVMAKLNRLEAERAAERIDSEQQYHQLERDTLLENQQAERGANGDGSLGSGRMSQ